MKYPNIPSLIVVAVAILASPVAIAEVGVIVGHDATTVQSGPYVSGIIDTADPIGGMVWVRYSASSGTRVLLNENGFANGDGRPTTTRNPVSGSPIVTWGKNNGSGFDIVESHFENGAWTAPAVIAGNVTTSVDPEPYIVTDRQTGDVHLVYFANDTAPAVMHTQAASDLSSWTSPALASQVAEYALRPSAVIHQGTLTIAYEAHGSSVGSTPRQIVVATADGAGGFTHESVTATHFGDPNRPRLHVGLGDSLWLDWVDDNNDMAWSVWQPGSSWGAVQVEPFVDVGDRDYHARGRVKHLATQF